MNAISRRTVVAGAASVVATSIVEAAAAEAAPPSRSLAIRGADMTFLPQLEEAGVRWSDLTGRRRPAEQILVRAGANTMRIRVWVNPPTGYTNLERALAVGRRAKAAGMKIMLDPHYSDFWADPGHQSPPPGGRRRSPRCRTRSARTPASSSPPSLPRARPSTSFRSVTRSRTASSCLSVPSTAGLPA